jgi:flagellin
MVIRLNPSVQSMGGNRFLEASSMSFQKVTQRLGSGLRIPYAAADASGLAIGKKLQVQTRGWQVAQRNIQDGVSLAQTAEGAMNVLHSIVGRIRELSVQAATGTLTDQDRQAVQDEISALRDNMRQVVESTQFNTLRLLKGQEFRPPPVVGVDGGPLFDPNGNPIPLPPAYVGLPGALPATANGSKNTETGTYNVVVVAPPTQALLLGGSPAVTLPGNAGDGVAINLTVSGALGSQVVQLIHGETPADWVTKINGAGVGVQATIEDFYGDGDFFLVVRSTGVGGSQVVSIMAQGEPTDPLPVDPFVHLGFGFAPTGDTGSEMVATVGGVFANVGSSGNVIFINVNSPGNPADGLRFQITNNPPPGWLFAPGFAGNVTVQAFPVEIRDLEIVIQSGPNNGDNQTLLISPMVIGAVSLDDAGTPDRIGTIDVTTQAGAQRAIDIADAAVEQISRARGRIGAHINTFEKALGVAETGEFEQGRAASRVMDADVAADAVALAQAQIQTQTATVALAHQNADAASVLDLISAGRVSVLIGGTVSSSSASGSGGSTAASSGGGSAPAPMSGSFSPSPTMTSGSGFAPSPALNSGGGFSPTPATPGYNPTAATPGYNPLPTTPGFSAMPVIGSGGSTGAGGLSAGQMFSMIAGSLV